jgi:hypothetical protein
MVETRVEVDLRMNFVDVIETMLGLQRAGKTSVSFSWFDMGRKIGVSFTFPSGRRHAVRVDFEPGWDFHVIDAMRFWLEDHPEVMVG